MTAASNAEQTAARRTEESGHRWLLFVHHLPSSPSNPRVRTWRRLQQLGAIPVKQAVHVLPDSTAAREDFEWLRTEIKSGGGDATIFAATNVDPWTDEALVDEFRRSRQEAYAALADDLERVLGRVGDTRRPPGTRAPALPKLLNLFRQRLTAIENVDFFGSAGRDRVTTLLKQLDDRLADQRHPGGVSSPGGGRNLEHFQGRLWVTRPRPGVDRMASAWLIQRFVDPEARFGFAATSDAIAPGSVPFDMFGVEFSHHGDGCTFETLCAAFAIEQPAVARVAAIVHDLDLKDGRFGASEAAAVGAVIEGLQLAYEDDDELLSHGITLFDALYRAFEHSARSAGPRPVARPRAKPASRRARSGPRRQTR